MSEERKPTSEIVADLRRAVTRGGEDQFLVMLTAADRLAELDTGEPMTDARAWRIVAAVFAGTVYDHLAYEAGVDRFVTGYLAAFDHLRDIR